MLECFIQEKNKNFIINQNEQSCVWKMQMLEPEKDCLNYYFRLFADGYLFDMEQPSDLLLFRIRAHESHYVNGAFS